MRSFISSSKPTTHTRAMSVLGLTALCTTLFLVGSEWLWQRNGFRPSVSDSKDLWAYTRHQAKENSENAVVTLGASRMQLDFLSAGFHEYFPEIAELKLTPRVYLTNVEKVRLFAREPMKDSCILPRVEEICL